MDHLPVIESEGLELVEGPGSSLDNNGLPLDKLGCKIVATALAICWIISAGRRSLREAVVGKLTAAETGRTTAVFTVVAVGGGGTMCLASDIVQPATINNRKLQQIANRVRIPLYSSLFSDSGVGLILSMVRSSPAIKQVYNCEANDVGPI